MLIFYIPMLIRIILSSSIFTARFLSFCVLLLSLTPMATLYVLWSTTSMHHHTMIATEEHVVKTMEGLLQQHNNMTSLEELWRTIMAHHWTLSSSYSTATASSSSSSSTSNPTQHSSWTHEEQDPIYVLLSTSTSSTMSTTSSTFFVLSPTNRRTMFQQLPTFFAVIVPWMMSILFGMIIPCMGFCHSTYQRRLSQRRKYERNQQLLEWVRPYQKVLCEMDRFVVPPEHVPERETKEEIIIIDNNSQILRHIPIPIPTQSMESTELLPTKDWTNDEPGK